MTRLQKIVASTHPTDCPGFDTPCWIWQLGCDRDGYGKVKIEGRTLRVHRWVFEQMVRKIRPGFTLDHLCRVHGCCNPAHMEEVTRSENIRRGKQGEFQKAKTHCPQGHEYSPENTKVEIRDGYTHRGCRACRREKARAYYRSCRKPPPPT